MEHFAWFLYVPEWHFNAVSPMCDGGDMGQDSDSYGNTILYAVIDRLRAHGMAVPPGAARAHAFYVFARPGLIVTADSAYRLRP